MEVIIGWFNGINEWLEHWEPTWLFLVLHGEFILGWLLLRRKK